MTRLCFLCGKKIGFLRSLTDQQYCSADHRREARYASAQVLRDEDELETWAIERSKSKKKTFGMPGSTAGQTASIFAFLTVGGLLIAAIYLPGPGTSYPPPLSLSPETKQGFLQRTGEAIGAAIRSSAPVTLHHDFHSGLSDWATVALKGGNVDDPRNWLASASAPELVRPGSLRLWTKSVSMQNYQMEFLGQMEKKSLSWAIRASDQNNYYATKLVMTRPGPLPNASLVRYAVMNGREWPRVQTILPLTIEKGVNYRVRMTVQDDTFVAYVNGQAVGKWTDNRLRHGGVGFFADEEDPQQIAWVNLSERDSFMGKLLAHFSFFVIMPGANMPGAGLPAGLTITPLP
jgi:hypothetical protein